MLFVNEKLVGTLFSTLDRMIDHKDDRKCLWWQVFVTHSHLFYYWFLFCIFSVNELGLCLTLFCKVLFKSPDFPVIFLRLVSEYNLTLDHKFILENF